jgi:hypothetical protein
VKPINKDEEQESMMNLGKRARKTIINMDNLTEQQWLRAVEEGEDLQEVMKRENLRREKRLAEGGALSMSDEDEYGSSEISSKRRKRSAKKRSEE